MKMMTSTMHAALALASRRTRIQKHAPGCLACRTRQVQLRDWITVPARWKCRQCKLRFVYEPLVIA